MKCIRGAHQGEPVNRRPMVWARGILRQLPELSRDPLTWLAVSASRVPLPQREPCLPFCLLPLCWVLPWVRWCPSWWPREKSVPPCFLAGLWVPECPIWCFCLHCCKTCHLVDWFGDLIRTSAIVLTAVSFLDTGNFPNS